MDLPKPITERNGSIGCGGFATILKEGGTAVTVPNNRYWYEQGRSDQRYRDWPVIGACLLAIAIYIVFVESKS